MSEPPAFSPLPALRTGETWPYALGVVLAAFLAFAPTLSFDLVWDDPLIGGMLKEAVREEGVKALMTFEWSPIPQAGYYRPVTAASFWFDLFLGPPWAFHLTNVLLHCACSLLVFLLFRRLAGSTGAAMGGGLLFALHPVHVESVAFASNRSDLWAAFWVLLAALDWVRSRESGTRSWRGVIRGGLFFFLAVLSKETAFLLPPILLLWDLLEGGPREEGRGWLVRNGKWILSWGSAGGIALILRFFVAGLSLGRLGSEGVFQYRLDWIGGILLNSLKLMVFPLKLNLWYTPETLVPAVSSVLGAFLALSVFLFPWPDRRWFRRWGQGAAPLGWFLLFLVPGMGLVPIGGAVTREGFLYLPSIGFCLAVALRLRYGWPGPWFRKGILLLGGALLLLYAGSAFLQSRVWKDERTLFSRMTEDAPGNPSAWYNLGNAYLDEERTEEAVGAFRKAVSLNDHDPTFHQNLGIALARQGWIPEAEDSFRRALDLRPGYPEAHEELGIALGRQKRWAEAVRELEESLRLKPKNPSAQFALVQALVGLGQMDLARLVLEDLRRSDPNRAARLDVFLKSPRPGPEVP